MVEILDLARELEEKGLYEDAFDKFHTAYIEKLGSFYIQCEMGRVLNKMQKYEEALGWFDSVLEMDESHQESLFGKAISKIGSNNFEDALDSFDKLILLDKLNANAWYYKAIISKEYDDNNANAYFRQFKNLDNEKFKETRSFYKFGILFDEIEYNFRYNRELNVISEIKQELETLNLNDYQYSLIFRTVPLENLFDKIIELKHSKSNDNVKDIIRDELIKQGFSNSDIDEMFELESVEDLKEQIIMLCEENPFLNNANNNKEHYNFVPMQKASKYNIYKNVKQLKRNHLYLFNRGNYYYDQNDFSNAINCYEECLKYDPDNMMLKFVKFCAKYNLKDDNDV